MKLCVEHNCGCMIDEDKTCCKACDAKRKDVNYGRCASCQMLMLESQKSLISRLCSTCLEVMENKVVSTDVTITLEREEWEQITRIVYGVIPSEMYMKFKEQL